MSTELKTSGKHSFHMTRFMRHGFAAVQLTNDEGNYIPVTRDDALYLAADLIIFANGLEQEDES